MAVEDPSNWSKAFDYAWAAVLVLVGLLWKGQSATIKSNKEATDKDIQRVENTQERILSHINDLFRNAERDRADMRMALDSHARRSEERHLELIERIHERRQD